MLTEITRQEFLFNLLDLIIYKMIFKKKSLVNVLFAREKVM